MRSVVLNDMRTTHGVARTSDKNEVCTTATGTVRHVTAKMKQQVWASYGISAVRRNGKNYEIDHLIPLELGGSNELSNLWPQPYRPQPAAREEDVLENYYHRQVCSGQMDVGTAQQAIARDWFGPWKLMVTSPH